MTAIERPFILQSENNFKNIFEIFLSRLNPQVGLISIESSLTIPTIAIFEASNVSSRPIVAPKMA